MSRERLEEHRRIWQRKPLLGDIYAVWFEALLAAIAPARRVLEVGSGPGFLSAYARRRAPGVRWVAADVIETPWNDVVANALRLPVRDGGLDALVAVDVIHHLARPGDFFSEAGRVLRPGGSLAAVEPWVTWFSYPIYRWLHQEQCRLHVNPWEPFEASGPSKDAFEGDAAIPWRLLKDSTRERWRGFGLGPPRVTILNGFAYVLSLGFRDFSLLSRRWAPLLLGLDERAAPLAPGLGMRALLVWEREGRTGRESEE